MKQEMYKKLKQWTLLMMSIGALLFFESCKKASEKSTEKIIETSIGNKANVDIDNEKIIIETEEGTFTSNASIKSWPKEIPNNVPEFTFGKMSNLSTQAVDEGKSWTFIFEDVTENAIEGYKKLLKDKGFKVSSFTMPGGQGQVTGENGNIIVAMMSGDNMATLNVSLEK